MRQITHLRFPLQVRFHAAICDGRKTTTLRRKKPKGLNPTDFYDTFPLKLSFIDARTYRLKDTPQKIIFVGRGVGFQQISICFKRRTARVHSFYYPEADGRQLKHTEADEMAKEDGFEGDAPFTDMVSFLWHFYHKEIEKQSMDASLQGIDKATTMHFCLYKFRKWHSGDDDDVEAEVKAQAETTKMRKNLQSSNPNPFE